MENQHYELLQEVEVFLLGLTVELHRLHLNESPFIPLDETREIHRKVIDAVLEEQEKRRGILNIK